MLLRTVIIDAARGTRRHLSDLLSSIDEVSVVGSYAAGTEAVRRITILRPELLFLQAEADPITLLEKLTPFNPLALVFTAEGEEHACRAFRVGAVDYLMKPLDAVRLREAVERALIRVRGLQSSEENPAGAPDPPQRPSHPLRWLPSESGEQTALTPVTQVHWISAHGKYVRIHHANVASLIRRSIGLLERELDSDLFLRVSRSAIINLSHVHHIERWTGGDYLITMHTGDRIVSTRSFSGRIRALLRGNAFRSGVRAARP
jgi:two-component system, LytTR family, response regulator